MRERESVCTDRKTEIEPRSLQSKRERERETANQKFNQRDRELHCALAVLKINEHPRAQNERDKPTFATAATRQQT